MSVANAVAAVTLAGAFAAQMARWLRVAQREHYEPAAMLRFLGRWSSPPRASAASPRRDRRRRPISLSHVLVAAVVVAAAVGAIPVVVAVTVAYGALCPWGLSLRGRTGRLVWTARLRRLAVVALVEALVVAGSTAWTATPTIGALVDVWAVPGLLDLAMRLLGPYENHLAGRFVAAATARLARVAPRVVAITGSYGKTSTKNHLADILAGESVVATPRSFNNRAGLSRAINENLADGTRVFIAEMGTYGPGEIRELTTWCPPEIAVVTAIGPVHLERMKRIEVIEAAKHEITERAVAVVLNVDDARLARWPNELQFEGKRVVRASAVDRTADVCVALEGETWRVVVEGRDVGAAPVVAGVQPTNLACALGAAWILGLDPSQFADRLTRISPVASRAQVLTAPSGVVVIDDTFNANPASAEAALATLNGLGVSGRRVVVTPGIIELGPDQYPENFKFAQRAAFFGDELVVVGRTNVVALLNGYGEPARRVDTRPEAVEWVRTNLRAGDAVLYLNDLPDHYP